MALISLFFQTKAKVGQLELDASLNETHEANAELSKSEIEDGETINDNVLLLPLKLSLEGVVSKTPLGIAGLIGSAGTALAGAAAKAAGQNKALAGVATTGVASIGGLVGSAVGEGLGGDGVNNLKSRSPSDVYDYLVEVRNQRLPFDVVTALKLYKNMVLTGLNAPRNIANSGVLRFTATLEQAKLVTSTVVSLGSGIPGADAAQNLGKQAGGAAGATTGSNASILFQVFKGG